MTFTVPEEWQPQGVEDLEERAWEALRETEHSVCVTAGAGAGKTEFLAQKATYLLQTGTCPPPKRILAISFKRDAARTLADRVRLRCPESQARRFISLTFDAFTKGLVDQFRMAIPEPWRPPFNYEISTPTNPVLNDFMDRAGITHLNPAQFSNLIARTRILDPAQQANARDDRIITTYYRDQYHGGARPYLTFPMINRLAEYLIRTNARIRRVLRLTYPFVFLDEFQDVTDPQFELVLAAFSPATTVCTAVGDDKQRIMGWAGAMPDAFPKFKKHFNASSISLRMNWRSHSDLVAIQHVIAARIDPNVEPVVARRARQVDGQISAIWEYPTRQTEVRSLSSWIAGEVEHGNIQPHDAAILVRMRPNDVENELAPAMRDCGLVLRNLARNVGSIAIQDLLVESLTEIVLPFLRVASTTRAPASWARACDNIFKMHALSDEDEIEAQRVSEQVEDVAKACRRYMRDNAPAPDAVPGLIELVIRDIGEASIRQADPAYGRQADFDRVREGIILLLQECVAGAESWPQALDRFEGIGQVPLLTVHKSKGMEFHTMIFFGLDSQSWWSLRQNNVEEISSFFVAFTRAEQRAYFTCCAERGTRIAWLDDLLGNTVPRVAGPRYV